MENKKSALPAVIEEQPELAQKAVTAMKVLLIDTAHQKEHPAVSESPADHLAHSLNTLHLNPLQKKSLLDYNPLLLLAGEMLLALKKKEEEERAKLRKALDEINRRNKKRAYDEKNGKKHKNELDAAYEAEKNPEKNAKHGDENPNAEYEQELAAQAEEHEFADADHDGEEYELSDLEEIAHDEEALREIDIDAWQHELMDDIKAMPSIGDQAAWMFMVSQLNSKNMAFRNEGAAHLMLAVKNAALAVEDQVVAFAGAEALRDPSSSLFDTAPGSLQPGGSTAPEKSFVESFSDAVPKAGGLSGMMVSQGGLTEDQYLALAEAHEHKEAAPFSVIEDHPAVPATQALHPKLALFKQDSADIAEAEAEEAAEYQAAYQQPQKAKSIFDTPHLKPNAAFFEAVLGKTSDN